MPNTAIDDALSQATADVLEKMFFTGFAAEPDEMADAGPQIAVRVPFSGGRTGVLMLRITMDAARTLAADFLGVDSGDGASSDQVHEVVRELANMICGDALSHVENGSLQLGVPELIAASEWNLPGGASRRSFDLDSGTLTVAVAFGDGTDA